MGSGNDTTADILAEMRKIGKLDEKSTDKIPRSLMGLGLRTYADRIEAAAKRERESVESDALSVGGFVEAERHRPGNAAAMREALMEIRDICLRVGANISPTSKKYQSRECQTIFACFRKTAAALAAPPRNCDVGTAEEQETRHCAWCHDHGVEGDNKVNCAHPDTSCDLCALRWAQMPYEEGGEE